MEKKVIFASNNKNKFEEIKALLASIKVDIHLQNKFHTFEVQELYNTFLENALAKARYASSLTNLPALGDDSGLCVNSLNGLPGLQSARYGGKLKLDSINNDKLIANLKSYSDKSAYYYCILVYIKYTHDPRPIIADGIWHGEILTKARGKNGFGYDSIFLLPKLNKTVAELSLTEKNVYSHRSQALHTLITKLN